MRTPSRIHILVIALLLVAGGLVFDGNETVGNQQGPGVGDRWGNLIGLCKLNGGSPLPTTSIDSVSMRFYCQGGSLDGLYCDIYSDLTYCYWDQVGANAGSPGGRQEVTTIVQDLTFVTDLEVDAMNPLTQVVSSQPMLVEAVISWNPSADAANQAREVQVNACRHLGGAEFVTQAGDDMHLVLCEGGLLDGMWCSMGVGANTCFFEPGTGLEATSAEPSSVPPTETSMPTVPAPTEAVTETPLPTVPMTPTDEPVIEPTFVDPTTDGPWTLPEGTIPVLEPAPSPTAGPLT